MATFTNQTKNTASFLNQIAKGKATLLRDLENVKFTDVVFADGTVLQDVTFDQLVAQVFTNVTKNTATWSNQTEN